MAKKATYSSVTNTTNNAAEINSALDAINAKLDNTLSIDGSTPNALNADFDVNSNDILNAGRVDATSLFIGGTNVVPSAVSASTFYASRSDAESANVPAAATRIWVTHDGSVYEYIKDATGTALTTGDGSKWSPVGQPFAGHWGAIGDSVTDNTTAIQAAIDWMADAAVKPNAPGGVLHFRRGGYRSGQIILKDRIILAGDSQHNTEIRAIDGLNDHLIKSENFDTLTGTNTATNDASVPEFIGLKDIRIHGNKANQTAGDGLRLFANAIQFDHVIVTDCFGNGLYTEAGEGGGVSQWPTYPAGEAGSIVIMQCGGHGWHMRGPHDMWSPTVKIILCDGDGLRMESSAGVYFAAADIGFLHVYHCDVGLRIINSALRCPLVRLENNEEAGLSIEGSQHNELGVVHLFDNCRVSGAYQGVIDATSLRNQVDLVRLRRAGRAAAGGFQCAGSHNIVNGTFQGDVTGGGNSTGVGFSVPAGAANNNLDLVIDAFSGTGAIGLQTNDTGATFRNIIKANISDCSTVWDNQNEGVNNVIDVAGDCDVSATRFSGVGPANGANRELWDATIRADASNYSLSEERIFGSFDLNSTTEQTVTYNHHLLTTPLIADVQLQIAYSGGLFAWEVAYARVVSVSSTQIVAKIKLATAAGSAGTGALWCHARL